MSGLALDLDLSPELIDAIAERVAEILTARGARDEAAEDAWLRGANAIAAYIGARPSRVYALSSADRIPVERDGSALVARKSDLDAWLRNGGGKRP